MLYRDENDVLVHEIIGLDVERRALDRIHLAVRGQDGRVVLLVDPAREVGALPLVLLGGDEVRKVATHMLRRIGLAQRDLEHLHVGVELGIGVGIADVGREEHGGHDRFQLDVDARLLAGLLDDGLRLLAWPVDRGLVEELQLLAVLLADAVGARLPAGVVENLGGLLYAELPRGVLGHEFFGPVEEVGGGAAGAAVDRLLDRLAIDQQRQRLAHRWIRKQRVLGLYRGAFAIDLGVGIGEVQRDEFGVAADGVDGFSLAALLQAQQHVVLDLNVPAEIIFAS